MRLKSSLLALLFALAAGCGGGDRSPVIASVNGRGIRLSEFDRFVALRVGEFKPAEANDAVRSQMLDEYLVRRIVLDEAARAGLSITDAEVEQTAQKNPRMKSTAAAAETREELINDLLVEKYYRQVVLRDVRVPAEEIQQYVQENQARLSDKPGFYVREIRVQSKDEADRLRREVTEGNRDFAAVARLHSDAPGAEQGGMARYNEGQLPAVLEKAIRPLGPGDVSPVIQSNFGFHIFKLERRIQPPAEDERRQVPDERRAQLAEEFVARRNQQALDEAIDRLVEAARVEINDSALGFTYTGRLRHN
jgi:peptidyl-prolyl cis-trans isomerase C